MKKLIKRAGNFWIEETGEKISLNKSAPKLKNGSYQKFQTLIEANHIMDGLYEIIRKDSDVLEVTYTMSKETTIKKLWNIRKECKSMV